MSFGIADESKLTCRPRACYKLGMAGETVVMAAYAPELDGLRPRSAVVTRAVGIGLVEASAGAARAIAELRPVRVLLVGTAGSSTLPVGSIVVASSARLLLRPGEASPEPMPLVVAAGGGLARSAADAAGGPLVEVVSTLGVTADDRLVDGSVQVEHLEAFGVMRAAERAHVPATAILAIANRIGAGAREEWQRNRQQAEAAAVQAVSRVLDRLAGKQ
jgi:nucleoside phosphorylase